MLVHGRQVPIAKKVLGASIEGKKIEPSPELNNFASYRGSGQAEEEEEEQAVRPQGRRGEGRRREEREEGWKKR